MNELAIQELSSSDLIRSRIFTIRGVQVMLDIEPVKIKEVATALIREHALPENETTDAYHIATAAYYGMDVLLTWNCKHIANEFTLPKTYNLLNGMGLKCPVILTPKRYMEDCNHD